MYTKGYCRKDIKVNLSLDTEVARVLNVIAHQEAEGNRSMAVRFLVREAAEKRGLWPTPDKPQVQREVTA